VLQLTDALLTEGGCSGSWTFCGLAILLDTIFKRYTICDGQARIEFVDEDVK
jgi:hypothetical protein